MNCSSRCCCCKSVQKIGTGEIEQKGENLKTNDDNEDRICELNII